jgi:hypothetical protein
MPVIDQSELVPYTPDEMYALVNDFESYPEFLPWCERAWVVAREADVLRAGLAVRKGAVHYSFTTDNRGTPPSSIQVSLADGYPLLLASTASLDRLNAALVAGGADAIPMNRFRANVVVHTVEPFAEDRWKRVRIGAAEFAVVKGCSRCKMPTIDQATAVPASPPPGSSDSLRSMAPDSSSRSSRGRNSGSGSKARSGSSAPSAPAASPAGRPSIIEGRREVRLGKGVRQIKTDRRAFGHHGGAMHNRRHLPHRVDRFIGRRAHLRPVAEVTRLIICAGLFEHPTHNPPPRHWVCVKNDAHVALLNVHFLFCP